MITSIWVSPSVEGLFLIVNLPRSELLSFISDTESLIGIIGNELFFLKVTPSLNHLTTYHITNCEDAICFTLRRTLPWPPNKVFSKLSVNQDVWIWLKVTSPCKVCTVFVRFVELTYLHVIFKYESLLDGHGNARCTVNVNNFFFQMPL